MVLVNLRLFLILWRGGGNTFWEVLHMSWPLGGVHRVSRIAYSVSHKSCRPGCGAQLIAMGGLGVGRGASIKGSRVVVKHWSGPMICRVVPPWALPVSQPSTASGQGPRPQSSGAPVFER